jgi:hypothetical protein
MTRSLRSFAVCISMLCALAAPCLAESQAGSESGTLQATHEPMPPPPKKIYTTDYLFAVTRSVTESTLVPAAQVPLVFLTIPVDVAFLPIEAIAGFFPRD